MPQNQSRNFPAGKSQYPQNKNSKFPEKKPRTLYDPNSCFLVKGTEKKITTIENVPFEATIHNPPDPRDGKYNKNITRCLVGFFDDHACEEILVKSKARDSWWWTVVDESSYTSEATGKTYENELKAYYLGFNEKEKFMEVTSDEPGGFEWAHIKIKRLTGDNSQGTGDSFKYLGKQDPEKLYPTVQFQGRLLSDIFDEANNNLANNNPDLFDEVKRIFNVELDDNGYIVHKLVSFNFEEILKAKHPNYIRKKFGGEIVENRPAPIVAPPPPRNNAPSAQNRAFATNAPTTKVPPKPPQPTAAAAKPVASKPAPQPPRVTPPPSKGGYAPQQQQRRPQQQNSKPVAYDDIPFNDIDDEEVKF